MDEDTFRHSILADESHSRFSTIKDFTNSVLRKVDQISLDPMEYVDKKLVAYGFQADLSHIAGTVADAV